MSDGEAVQSGSFFFLSHGVYANGGIRVHLLMFMLGLCRDAEGGNRDAWVHIQCILVGLAV